MALLPEDAVEELLRLYGESELEAVRPLIGSRTLREHVRLVLDADRGLATLQLDEYWAVYYHDGRAGFSADAGRMLVYYADPDDDPRIAGGYPVDEGDVVRLTRTQFEEGLAENRVRAEAGEGPFMFVLRSVGPAGAHPFFDQLAEGAAVRMDQFASFALDAFVQSSLDEEGPQRSTATVRM